MHRFKPSRQPVSYSVAPAPRLTERVMAAMGWAVQDREFGSTEELNQFIASPEGQEAMETAEPTEQWERAQALAYEAWEAERPLRYHLAREALAIDPRCSDAWLILAEEERAWRKQRRCFERAVAAARQACAEERWLEDPEGGAVEKPYAHLPVRSYLRAHVALARCLLEGGYAAEARQLYEEMLNLDREDHMGLRYELLVVYHRLGEIGRLRALLDRFGDGDDCHLAHERLWLALVEGAGEAEIERRVEAARAANPHVLDLLLGRREYPDEIPDYMPPGGPDEAAAYVALAARWWVETPATLAWLKQEAKS